LTGWTGTAADTIAVMTGERRRVLLGGPPGCGKTTAIDAALRELVLAGVPVGGFVTRERRNEAGRRYGFDVLALAGPSRQVSDVGWSTGVRVGRYGVDIPAFEAVALPALRRAMGSGDGVVVIDELGLVQLNSPAFVELLAELLGTSKPILATVHTKPHRVTDAIKARPDFELIAVTEANRDTLPCQLVSRFSC
jgi:nucleoside-triphosphatase